MTDIQYWIAMAFIYLLPLITLGQSATLVASVDKNPLSINDVFTLKITLTNGKGNIETPDLNDFRVVFGPSRSSSYRIVNGQQVSSITYSYTLRPKQTGILEIGAAKANVDGKLLTTSPIKVEVLKGSSRPTEHLTYKSELGEYLSIKDHIKSKDVNLKLQVPQGWQVKDGDRPNIVKKFTKNGNAYLILIKENMTFLSRNESKELLRDESVVSEFVEESISFLKNPEVIDKSVVTVDTYPTLTYKVKGMIERTGVTIEMIMKCWVVFYEDKIVFLQSMGFDNADYRAYEQLYYLITNSVIFPDQYN